MRGPDENIVVLPSPPSTTVYTSLPARFSLTQSVYAATNVSGWAANTHWHRPNATFRIACPCRIMGICASIVCWSAPRLPSVITVRSNFSTSHIRLSSGPTTPGCSLSQATNTPRSCGSTSSPIVPIPCQVHVLPKLLGERHAYVVGSL